MSQRTDQRAETLKNLDAYNWCLKLTKQVLSITKIKEKNQNTKHIIKRQRNIGNRLENACLDLGEDILDANDIYIGNNLETEDLIANLRDRIDLQKHALRMTYRMEHTIRVLHDDRPFAESTINYLIDFLLSERDCLKGWLNSDKKKLKEVLKGAS